jgi:hypothetical protein
VASFELSIARPATYLLQCTVMIIRRATRGRVHNGETSLLRSAA